MSRIALIALAAGLLAASAPIQTYAAIVYSDTFDSGASLGTASAYFSNQGLLNGEVIRTTNSLPNGAFANAITADVGGSGYFLFNGTNGSDVPAGQNAFYISRSFAVTANTGYVLSFYLTNANTINVGQVQAQFNGTTIGSPISATGSYSSNGWQLFNLAFNSGAATTGTVTLNDLQITGFGNDFGIDNIAVASAVPEPSSLALCGIAGAAGLVLARSQQRRLTRV